MITVFVDLLLKQTTSDNMINKHGTHVYCLIKRLSSETSGKCEL